MDPVLLPTSNFYVTVDRQVLQWAMGRIEQQFRDLLENGAQARGVPAGIYAAGQHLNPYSANQRGLFGTAAALLVLGRSRPSSRRLEFIEGLIKYVNERPVVEKAMVRSEEDEAWLTTRLLSEGRAAFKVAELLYALSAAPPAAVGRETLLTSLLERIKEGHRASGGWAVDLDPVQAPDPLATASVVRGLHAAGIAVDDVDLKIVQKDAFDSLFVSPYVRIFCLLVLFEVQGVQDETSKVWNTLFESLQPELHDRTEANYEFRLGNRQEYVRIPWQLYLISGAALCRPSSLIFESGIRRALLDAIQAVATNAGYIYPAFGHMKSTRTYSILMDTLWRVQDKLTTSRYIARLSSIANIGIRLVYSRAVMSLAVLAALALIGLALYSWATKSSDIWSAVGPEILSAVLLGVLSFLLSRIRAGRRLSTCAIRVSERDATASLEDHVRASRGEFPDAVGNAFAISERLATEVDYVTVVLRGGGKPRLQEWRLSPRRHRSRSSRDTPRARRRAARRSRTSCGPTG